MIFMKFFSRNSRATGPKMRVPRGLSCCSFKMTAALSSKRIIEPSGLENSFDVRTTTARTTSPFFTGAPGVASLTAAFTSVKNRDGALKLLNLTKKVHDLMQITKLYTVFDVYDDERTALASFGS